MAAPKKTFDMEAVSKAAVAALAQLGSKATSATVIEAMRNNGSTIAATRLAVLLKELSASNRLEGFYLRRGTGFVHENDVPRTEAKKSKKKSKAKAKALTPSAIADEIRSQERAKAEDEYRAQVRAEERARVGLTG